MCGLCYWTVLVQTILLKVSEERQDSGRTGMVHTRHPDFKREVTAPAGVRQAWLIPSPIGYKLQGQPL